MNTWPPARLLALATLIGIAVWPVAASGQTPPGDAAIGLPPGLSNKLGEAVAWQAALDRAGFSPGVIDGMIGPQTLAGVRAFQQDAGLPVTGQFDAATRQAIRLDATPAIVVYVITRADRAAVGPCPRDWVAKSKLRRLGFASLEDVAAHRGHCRRELLARLNPAVHLKTLKPGSKLMLPNVRPAKPDARAAALEIDFGTKIIRAFDRSGGLVGLFHCSIAKEKSQRPTGRCQVKTVTTDPQYTFKPESWPEVRGVHRRLTIPPGPRNPVGLCWIGLTKKGYGIHGTPQPELIGKTGSHGCFRMTNWDVLRLAEIVRIGTEVRFVDSTGMLAQGG